MKLTTERHVASRGLSVTAELLVRLTGGHLIDILLNPVISGLDTANPQIMGLQNLARIPAFGIPGLE